MHRLSALPVFRGIREEWVVSVIDLLNRRKSYPSINLTSFPFSGDLFKGHGVTAMDMGVEDRIFHESNPLFLNGR